MPRQYVKPEPFAISSLFGGILSSPTSYSFPFFSHIFLNYIIPWVEICSRWVFDSSVAGVRYMIFTSKTLMI